jgi:dUTP pyrophosphatase
LSPNAKTPTKSYPYDAGFDLSTTIGGDLWVQPGKRYVIPTGIACQIPPGYYGRIADRSGNAYKSGIHILGGVIDSGYTDEIKVIMLNTGNDVFCVSPGDRIAQLVITPIPLATMVEVSSLDISERGQAGFGSTGK